MILICCLSCAKVNSILRGQNKIRCLAQYSNSAITNGEFGSMQTIEVISELRAKKELILDSILPSNSRRSLNVYR